MTNETQQWIGVVSFEVSFWSRHHSQPLNELDELTTHGTKHDVWTASSTRRRTALKAIQAGHVPYVGIVSCMSELRLSQAVQGSGSAGRGMKVGGNDANAQGDKRWTGVLVFHVLDKRQ